MSHKPTYTHTLAYILMSWAGELTSNGKCLWRTQNCLSSSAEAEAVTRCCCQK